MDQRNIRQGTEVRSSDGEKLGKVVGMQGQYVVVEKGFFFPTDYYIPASAISSTTDDAIHLSVSKDQALNSGWDQAPTETGAGYADTTAYAGTTGTATTGTTTTGTVTPGATVTGAAATGATTTGMAAGDVGTTRTDVAATGEDVVRVPVYEEELTATKRPVDQGEVRVEKDVVAEDKVLDVPVTQERVHVTRRTVDRDATPDDTTFQEGTIEVPVRGEEVDVQKRVREVEEVDIAKEAVQGTKRVEGTVRREQVHIDDDTVDTTGTGTGTGTAPSS